MSDNNTDQYDLEMVDVEDSSDDDEFDTTTDSEYGEDSLHEQTLTPNTVTANSPMAKADFYRTSMKRQNICFGTSVFVVVGMFIAAYFYMGIDFSPSNAGIFGDEQAMKGAAGEVGLDADNAETQQIIDQEITELQETGHWGENAKKKRNKIDDIIFDKDRIGEHEWVQDSNWWKNNMGNMDVSNMTKTELKAYKKMKKSAKRQKEKDEEEKAKAAKKGPKSSKTATKEGELEDIDDIKQKLANLQHNSKGAKENAKHTIDELYRMKQKHNGPRPDDWLREKNEGDGDGVEEQETTEIPENETGDAAVEENGGTEENNEQLDDAGEVDGGHDAQEEQDGDVTTEEEGNTEETNDHLEDIEEVNEEGNEEEEGGDGTTEETNEQPEDIEEGNEEGDNTEEKDGDVTVEEEGNAEETEELNEQGHDTEEQEDTAEIPDETTDHDTSDTKDAAETNDILEDAEKVNEEELIDATISTAYTVLEQDTHDRTSFTQGISYCSDGKIYETTGLYGQSKVRRINPDTFEVEVSIDTPGEFFGEGSTCFVGKDGKEYLIEITWRERRGFLYAVPSLELLHSFEYTTTAPGNQGWGITYDPENQELIVSDGSEFLYFWDVENFTTKRKVAVTRFDGSRQGQINELEFMDGLVCYNIWHQDDIICADPVTGKSVREYDFSGIWPANKRGNSENVLNGIALGKDHVLITGKRWDRIYKVVFTDWPTLFDNNN